MRPSTKQILCLLLILFSTNLLEAQQWNQAPGPEGGSIAGVVELSTDTWLAATTFGGIYKTINNGDSWTLVGDELVGVESRAIDVVGSSIVVASENGIYRSTDAGDTWAPSNTGLLATDILSLKSYNSQFWIGYVGGISTSSDGASWTSASTGIGSFSEITAISGDISNTSLLAASSDEGLYMTTNGGTSWGLVTVTGASSQDFGYVSFGIVADQLAVLGSAGESFHSDDAGSTWNSIAGVSFEEGYTLFKRSGGSGIYAGTTDGLLVMSADGLQWSQAFGSNPANTNVSAFFTGGSSFMIGTSGGVYRSTDVGSTWLEKNSGIIAHDITAFGSSGIELFVSTLGGGFFVSDDDGVSWTAKNSGISGLGLSILSMHSEASLLLIGTTHGIYKSTNNGDTWTAVNTGLNGLPVSHLAVNGSTYYALELVGGVSKSVNAGDTWASANGTTGNEIVGIPVSLMTDGANVYTGNFFGDVVSKSSDGGDTWVAADNGISNSGFNLASYLFALGGDIYASTAEGFFVSSNQGGLWTASGTGLPATVSGHALLALDALFFSVENSGVYKSTDLGANFSAYNTDLDNLNTGPLKINGSDVLVGTSGSGVWGDGVMFSGGGPSAPDQPAPVTFGTITDNSIVVNWTAPNDNGASITSYSLEQKEGAGGLFTEIFSGNALTHTATGLNSGTEYFYRVLATNSEGNSPFSTESGATTTNTVSLSYAFVPDISKANYTGSSFSVQSEDNTPMEVEFNIDGTKLFILGNSGNEINEYELTTPFDLTTISFSATHSISEDANQPVVMEFVDGGKKLFVKRDGNLVSTYTLTQGYDLTTRSYQGSQFVTGVSTGTHSIAFSNSGTQYISFTATSMLEYTVNPAFSFTNATIANNYTGFALEQSVAYDFSFSPEGEVVYPSGFTEIYAYNLPSSYSFSSPSLTGSFSVQGEMVGALSMDLDKTGTRMFVLGDDQAAGTTHKIFEYDFGSFAFIENMADDGSVAGKLIIRIEGNDTFVNPGGELNSSHFNISNLPAGFSSPVLLVAGDGKSASLTLSGNSTSHDVADNVTDLQFTFLDAAFVSSNAVDVINATGPASSNLGIAFEDTPTAPDAPAAPTFGSITENSIVVNWLAPTDNGSTITSYTLEQKEGAGGTFSEIFSGDALTHTAVTLNSGTEYFFRVKATNGVGDSPFSSEASASTSSVATAPEAPTLSVVTTNAFGVTLNWTTPSNTGSSVLVSYELERKGPGESEFSPIATIDDLENSFIVEGLSAKSNYTFRIRAVNSELPSDYSNEVAVETLTSVPSQPDPVSFSEIGKNSVRISWTEPTNNGATITEYWLEIKTTSASSYQVAYTGLDLTAVVSTYDGASLQAGTEYEFRLLAFNSNGQSDYSTSATVTTLSKQDQSITVAEIPDKTFGDADFDVAASASSGLPVTLSSTGPISLSGTTISITGVGLATVVANQSGDDDYNAAPEVVASFIISPASQSIQFSMEDVLFVNGLTLTLNGEASSGLPVSYTFTGTDGNSTITGDQFSIAGPGSYTVTASQSGNDNYFAAENVSATICVNPPTPEISASGLGTSNVSLQTGLSSFAHLWYLDGVVMFGGAEQTSMISIESAGIYTTEVTVAGCVSERSDELALIITDLERSLSADFSLYPNPTTDKVYLNLKSPNSTDDMKFRLTDMQGRIWNVPIQSTKESEIEIDVSTLKRGVYLLYMETNSIRQSIKIHKQ